MGLTTFLICVAIGYLGWTAKGQREMLRLAGAFLLGAIAMIWGLGS